MVPIHGYTTPAPPPSCSTNSLQARCSRSPSLDRVSGHPLRPSEGEVKVLTSVPRQRPRATT